MKIYCPMFWSLDQGIDYSAPIIHLADIVPRAGQTTFAYFDRSDTLHIGETLQLIWCPPVSDLNGWSEQPRTSRRPIKFEMEVFSCSNATNWFRN
ncbi:hypothetical protein [Pseudomonas sp. TH43]|uniref:hypothetical protein n=1 Tax=Pseudomonas sp. TH43 TaxID=2796407 RepID=UPI001F5B435C|nr:hypothetical protein [Pseudomonas sp. TH43]